MANYFIISKGEKSPSLLLASLMFLGFPKSLKAVPEAVKPVLG